MTREEQKDISEFVNHTIRGDHSPMDVEADAIIRAMFARNQDAAYRMTMLAMTLAAAQCAAAAPAPPQRRGISSLLRRRLTSRRPIEG